MREGNGKNENIATRLLMRLSFNSEATERS